MSDKIRIPKVSNSFKRWIASQSKKDNLVQPLIVILALCAIAQVPPAFALAYLWPEAVPSDRGSVVTEHVVWAEPGGGASQTGTDICKQGYVWREATPSDHVCVTPQTRDQARSDNAQAASRRNPGGPYGPDTCKPGYVWREATPNDHVCVTPQTRDQARADNEQAANRRESGGGSNGPDTCESGYVWREATPSDHVCVTPKTRDQTRFDNAQAAGRRQPGGGPYGPDTCRAGYVWREAVPSDRVCVTPQVHQQTLFDNSQASFRTTGGGGNVQPQNNPVGGTTGGVQGCPPHNISSLITARWQKEATALGCPVSDEMDTPPGTSAHYKGRFVQYQQGQIVFSPSTGPTSLQVVIGYPYGQQTIIFEWGPTAPFHYDKFLVRWNQDGQSQQQLDLPGGDSGRFVLNNNIDLARHRYSIIVEGCDNGTFGSDCKQGWSNEAYVGNSASQPPTCSPSITASFTKNPTTLNISGRCFGLNNLVLLYAREGLLQSTNFGNPLQADQNGNFPNTQIPFACDSGSQVAIWAVGGNRSSNSVTLVCP